MRTPFSQAALFAAAVAAFSGAFSGAFPGLAFAQQPGDPAAPEAAPPPPQPQPQIDEARIREIVDREIARVLTERATKEAAERAAKEAAEKEAPPPEKESDLTGQSGFMDTRLAFTLTNENIFAKPGETIPSVPGWRFGVPNSLGVLFFDNYDTRFSGFETMSHAVAYRSYSRGHLQAEGAFVLRINELSETEIALADAGSYLVITNWKDPTHKDPTRISLTAFPVSSDRFRLGYSYRLSWGGTPEFTLRRPRGGRDNSTPGIKLQYDTKNMYAFVGAKSALVVDPRDGEPKGVLSGLLGAGIDPHPNVRVELNGGLLNRGHNVLKDVEGEKVLLGGGSAQVSVFKGMPIRSSVDYRLYKYNGERVSQLFSPEKYPGGIAWLAQAEFTTIAQTLKDPERTGSTKRQYGMAGDLNFRMKINRYRLRLDFSYRDLAFILHSQPSQPSYQDFPAAYTLEANYFAAVGADRNWGDWLTLGLIGGIERPASLTSPKGIQGAPEQGTATTVFRNNNINTIISILPPGETVVPQLALKGTAKLDFAQIFSAVFDVFYSHDPNQSHFRRSCIDPSDPDTCFLENVFGEYHQLGFNVTLQARF